MQNYRSSNPPKTLLDAAAWGNLTAVQKFLAQGAKPDQRDTNGWTALHHAVGYGQLAGADVLTDRRPNEAVVRLLAKSGAPLNLKDQQGYTPLMLAVVTLHAEAATWLVSLGADVKVKNDLGATALTYALSMEAPPPLITLLRSKGTPLSLWDALWLRDTPLALRLLESARLTDRGLWNYTYLHLAAYMGNLVAVERLLARKANVNARADNSWAVLHLALGQFPLRGQMGVYWHRYPLPGPRELLIQKLIAAGADVAVKDSEQRTPVAWAIGMKQAPLVRRLLKAGSDPNQRSDEYGEFLLSTALETKNVEVVRAVLEGGARPNNRDEYHDPALFAAISTNEPTLVRLVLEAGGDPHAKSIYKKTALSEAKASNNPQILALVKAALQKPIKSKKK
jgi:ankyrin repeat protein